MRASGLGTHMHLDVSMDQSTARLKAEELCAVSPTDDECIMLFFLLFTFILPSGNRSHAPMPFFLLASTCFLWLTRSLENHITFFLIENINERFFTSSSSSASSFSSSSSTAFSLFRRTYMVTLLAIQVLSIVATALTNLVGILAFATDYWSIVVYDLAKLRSYTSWSAMENVSTGDVQIQQHLNIANRTDLISFNERDLPGIVFGINNETALFKMHKGIFRQCNYLSINVRQRLKLSQCRLLKLGYNRYDDVLHGLNNPGRELIRKYLIVSDQIPCRA